MPWYFPWTDSIKKRACRYLLQRYLGQFLQEKLSLNQLSIDLYNGTGTIKELQLDVDALNELLETANLPLEIIDGFVGSISVVIPWSALLIESSVVEISGLEFTVQPKQRLDDVAMFESMVSSMTTSMQLAQECLRQDITNEEAEELEFAQPFEGLESFAQTIESVLSRIRVTFLDVIVRLEHVPKECKSGVGLELRIDRIEYFDEAGSELSGNSDLSKTVHETPIFVTKVLQVFGLTVFCDEFPAYARTHSRGSSSMDLFMSAPESPTDTLIQPRESDSPPTTSTFQSNPIVIGKFSGKHEVKVKLKQNDAVSGPKFELDGFLGYANFFLSPRQVHILAGMLSGLIFPETEDSSNVSHQARNKPMQAADYQKIESDLQKQIRGVHTSRRPEQDLVTAHLDFDEDYFPVSEQMTTVGVESMVSSISSDISTTSTAKSDTSVPYGNYFYTGGKLSSPFRAVPAKPVAHNIRHHSVKQKGKHGSIDDPAADLTRYKVTISCLSVTVLHEDPASSSLSAERKASSTGCMDEKQKRLADAFFEAVMGISVAGYTHQLHLLREDFARACSADHLRLIASPITLEACEKKSISHRNLVATVTTGNAEVVECLFEKTSNVASQEGPLNELVMPHYSELLKFTKESLESPSIKVSVDIVERISPQVRRTRNSSKQPKTEIHIELADCSSDIDISIVDRLHTLLNPHWPPTAPTSSMYKPAASSMGPTPLNYFSQAMDEGPSPDDNKVDLHISSSLATFNVHFPIADLRPEQNRRPWWQRELRKEVLILDCTELYMHTVIGNEDGQHKLEFTSKEVHVAFRESPSKPPISIGRISRGTNGDSFSSKRDEEFDWPRVVLKFNPGVHRSVLEEQQLTESDPESSSMPYMDETCNIKKPEPSPFSSRKVMYESEEMVMPGDKQEMMEFQDKAAVRTEIVLELNLPNVNVFLPSKDLYELIYNRLCNDLFLWESLAPAPKEKSDHCISMAPLSLASHLLPKSEYFSLCKSALPYDSDSESEDESGQYSTEQRRVHRYRQKAEASGPSKVAIILNVAQGQVTLRTPIKDVNGEEILGRHGQLVAQVTDGSMFLVACYKGQPEVAYMWFLSNRFALFHRASVSNSTPCPKLERVTMKYPTGMDPTLYKSESGVHTKLSGQVGSGGDSLDMLSVALKLNLDTYRSIKDIVVALAVRGATLQYRVSPAGQTWLDQVMDFFKVYDYPVLGYSFPAVVTELHVHVYSCAVDYRPLYLPLRAIAVVEAFSVSSNVVAESPTSLLRFILEDASLYLSEKCEAPVVELKKNYVCVMDLGLFELVLRMSTGQDRRYPKVDMRASNNILHIRTCADSCIAMQRLLTYLAADGDLTGDSISTASSKVSTTETARSDSPLQGSVHGSEVHDLMAEAMRESCSSSPEMSPGGTRRRSHDVTGADGCEVFFFPDEGNRGDGDTRSMGSAEMSGSKTSTTTATTDDTEEVMDDEEFCIINDPGLGIIPRSGEPEIRILTHEPVKVVDNHFKLPEGKADQLKAPEHFPVPVMRYTLREMTVVWHMYGGHDFEKYKLALGTMASPAKSPGDFMPMASPSLGTISRERPYLQDYAGVKTKRLSWVHRGGPGRCIDTCMELQLSKIRFQFEQYPDTTAHASRIILMVKDVEIRDRLHSSQINKFLYQYTSEARPKQAHANMVVVKAVNMRPEKNVATEECSLKISIQPLRLNVDQDALFFLRDFFTEITVDTGTQHESGPKTLPDPPVMLTQNAPEQTDEPEQEMLLMFGEDSQFAEELQQRLSADHQGAAMAEDLPPVPQPIFFKSFVFSPEVPIRLDYQGKRVDMEQGTFTGLIIGLAQFNCTELKLKKLSYRHGLLGLDKLAVYAVKEWLEDIKKCQIPNILGGVGPMSSLVQLVQGVKDLFWLPIEQYRKDGRIVRGLQRGAVAFSTTTTMAVLELTHRTVQSIQSAAETAYDMMSPGPSVKLHHPGQHKRHPNATQPADLREGATKAYYVLKEGIGETTKNLVQVATEEHEHKGVYGAVGGVLRQIPGTVVKPVIFASEATSNVLGGMRNQLQPDARKEAVEKWKKDYE
ncbi:PREDICTED: autophagy-related protein 2 homolog B-like isoform X2 [Priapulus caudatus]|uniref:Autophagy-related protein 2 n=1 Tax=Priapulus caudatus TaxID=37621 RepID=A0ABM1DVB9_PRICU|nr:PREDICTED: autophagy-related protein 2 homolog B-like isoform X2 [Priapulus caudatus]